MLRDGRVSQARYHKGMSELRRAVAAHGTRSGYQRHRRHGEEPCARCRRAQNAGVREANERQRARFYAAGLNGNGQPRRTFYDQRALDLMARFGLRPDRRFVQPETW